MDAKKFIEYGLSAKLKGEIQVLSFPNVIHPDIPLTEFLRECSQMSCQMHILNFSKVQEINPDTVKSFSFFRNELARVNRPFYSVKLNGEILSELKSQGLDSAFRPVSSIEEACRRENLRVPRRSLPSEIVISSVEETIKLFSAYSIPEAHPQKPTKKDKDYHYKSIVIAVLFPLLGKDYKASIRFLFSSRVAVELMKGYLGKLPEDPVKEISTTMPAVAMEIFDSVREKFEKTENQFIDATPQMIAGRNTIIRNLGSTENVMVQIDSPVGEMILEFVSAA